MFHFGLVFVKLICRQCYMLCVFSHLSLHLPIFTWLHCRDHKEVARSYVWNKDSFVWGHLRLQICHSVSHSDLQDVITAQTKIRVNFSCFPIHFTMKKERRKGRKKRKKMHSFISAQLSAADDNISIIWEISQESITALWHCWFALQWPESLCGRLSADQIHFINSLMLQETQSEA